MHPPLVIVSPDGGSAGVRDAVRATAEAVQVIAGKPRPDGGGYKERRRRVQRREMDETQQSMFANLGEGGGGGCLA